MPIHQFAPIEGSIEVFTIESAALRNNLLNDPSTREVSVYLPPKYQPNQSTPLLIDLVGFTGSGKSHLSWKPYAETVPQRHERLVREGKMGPCVIAFPDCFTSLGGNQYIDSIAVGAWATFITEEMLPQIEKRYQTIPGAKGRAVFGKSSGGYGAIVHGLRYQEHWGALACHSGDMGFDRLFLGDFPKILNMLNRYNGIKPFLNHIDNTKKIEGDELHTLLILAMAATYDPCPQAYKGIRLPCDHYTCELKEERWRNWLTHDPVILLNEAKYQNNLRQLKGIYIDCGSRDQYHIHYGNRQFAQKLQHLAIPHEYHEFDDNHSSVDYRMNESLPFLYKALID